MKKDESQKKPKNDSKTDIKDSETELESIVALIEKRRNLDQERKSIQEKYPDDLDALRSSSEFKTYQLKRKAFLQEYIINPDEMRTIIEEKQAKTVTSRQLNCSIFENMKSNEFKDYLTNLIKNADSFMNQRFQIVIQSSKPIGIAYHWSAADILINKNEIEIIHFDSITAAYVPLQAGVNGNELEEVLKSLDSPKPIKMIDSYTQINEKNVNLQYDHESCSIFALSTALTMSKIPNLHDLARDKATMEGDSNKENNLTRYSIESIHLPPSLLRNSQSYGVIEHYEKTHQEDNLNKIQRKNYEKTLKEYAKSRSKENPKTKKPENIGILFTREHYKKIIKEKEQQNRRSNDKKAFFEKPNETNEMMKIKAQPDEPEKK